MEWPGCVPRRPEEETGRNPAEASPSGREAWVGGGIGVRAARAVLPPTPSPANEQARAEAKRCGVSARPRGLAQPFVGVSGWPCSLGLGRSVCQQAGAVCLSPASPLPRPQHHHHHSAQNSLGDWAAPAPPVPPASPSRAPPPSAGGLREPGALTCVQAARLGAAVRGGVAGRRVRVGVGEPCGLRLASPALVVAGLDGIRPAPAAAHPPALLARPAAARFAVLAVAQPRRRSPGRRGGGGGGGGGGIASLDPPAPQPGAQLPRRQPPPPPRPLPARPSSPPPPRPSPSPPLLPHLPSPLLPYPQPRAESNAAPHAPSVRPSRTWDARAAA